MYRVSEDELLCSVFEKTIKTHSKEITWDESNLKDIHIYLAAEHTPGQNGRYKSDTCGTTLIVLICFSL